MKRHRDSGEFEAGRFRLRARIVVGLLFATCTGLLLAYKLNKHLTIQMADELAERRQRKSVQPSTP